MGYGEAGRPHIHCRRQTGNIKVRDSAAAGKRVRRQRGRVHKSRIQGRPCERSPCHPIMLKTPFGAHTPMVQKRKVTAIKGAPPMRSDSNEMAVQKRHYRVNPVKQVISRRVDTMWQRTAVPGMVIPITIRSYTASDPKCMMIPKRQNVTRVSVPSSRPSPRKSRYTMDYTRKF